jgi:hypothetical protein
MKKEYKKPTLVKRDILPTIAAIPTGTINGAGNGADG